MHRLIWASFGDKIVGSDEWAVADRRDLIKFGSTVFRSFWSGSCKENPEEMLFKTRIKNQIYWGMLLELQLAG